MKAKIITLFKNGAKVRAHNRQLGIVKVDGYFVLEFLKATEDANDPSCSHDVFRNKVRCTQLAISEEGLEDLITAYTEFKNQKP